MPCLGLLVALSLSQAPSTAPRPSTPEETDWSSLAEVLPGARDDALLLAARFDLPPPRLWPAPLDALWNEGYGECATIARASPKTGTSGRCCAIRLGKTLRKRLALWREHAAVPGLHEGPQALSLVETANRLGLPSPSKPLALAGRCPSLPSKLEFADSNEFTRALAARWSTVAGTAKPAACTLTQLSHPEPMESGGAMTAGELVVSAVLRCGDFVAVDEVAPNLAFVNGYQSLDKLLAAYADAVCTGTRAPTGPRAAPDLPADAPPVQFVMGGKAPSTPEQAVRCDGLPATLTLVGTSHLRGELETRWAGVHGAGPAASCTVADFPRLELLEYGGGGRSVFEVARTVLTCGPDIVAVDSMLWTPSTLGGQPARGRAADSLLEAYAARRCAALKAAPKGAAGKKKRKP